MPEQEFKPLDNDFTFEQPATTYAASPVDELLEFHVVQPETTTQKNQFKTTPTGEPNPDYGKDQPVLIFKAMLDSDVTGKGQIYSRWITGYYKDGDTSKPVYSLGDRSTLGKIAKALAGSVDEFTRLKTSDLIGLPFQCTLKPGSKNPERLLLDTDKILKASKAQSRVTTDVVPMTVPDAVNLDDIPF